MTVQDYMTSFLRIKHDTVVQKAAAMMDERGTGSALIVENDAPVGILTERDFLRKIVAKGLDPTQITVDKIMTSPIITIGVNEKLKDASLLMDRKNIRRLAVVNEKAEIVGKITAHGISRGLGFQKLKKAFSSNTQDYYVGGMR